MRDLALSVQNSSDLRNCAGAVIKNVHSSNSRKPEEIAELEGSASCLL